jgi:hypothetical protein
MRSAREELIEQQQRQMERYHNSAVGRIMEERNRRDFERLNSPAYMAMQEHARRMNDPMFWLMQRASEEAALRRKERGLWFYRRTTSDFSREKIRKAVNRLLERLFPKKFDPESFARRVRAALSTQDNCDGVVKVHSPPMRISS